MVPEAEFWFYYGRPIVKAPVWTDSIAAYTFNRHDGIGVVTIVTTIPARRAGSAVVTATPRPTRRGLGPPPVYGSRRSSGRRHAEHRRHPVAHHPDAEHSNPFLGLCHRSPCHVTARAGGPPSG
jgi:hypothetical protein